MRAAKTHDYIGETKLPLVVRCLWDEQYDRLEVEHFDPDMRPGDFVLWNPRQDVMSIRRYWVASAYREPSDRQLVTLVASPAPVRVSGEIYRR